MIALEQPKNPIDIKITPGIIIILYKISSDNNLFVEIFESKNNKFNYFL